MATGEAPRAPARRLYPYVGIIAASVGSGVDLDHAFGFFGICPALTAALGSRPFHILAAAGFGVLALAMCALLVGWALVRWIHDHRIVNV